MNLLKKLDKRRWILPSGKEKVATFGLFECPICKSTKEISLTKGNSTNTCGLAKCISTLKANNQSKTFQSIVGLNGNYKDSPFYRTFQRMYDGMKQRCYNPKNKRYEFYGNKNIKICDRWLNFESFVDDMFIEYEQLKNSSTELKTSPSIDRIDKTKDYSPENCEWIPYGENSAKDKRIPINQMDFEGNIVATFRSMFEAQEQIKSVPFGATSVQISITQIHRVCDGRSDKHCGYKWEYASDKTTLA